jgi:hypothetical protein
MDVARVYLEMLILESAVRRCGDLFSKAGTPIKDCAENILQLWRNFYLARSGVQRETHTVYVSF